jgi:thioredoxin 1
MAYNDNYLLEEPTPAEIEALQTPAVLEFGTPGCGYCQAAKPFIAEAFADYPRLSHIKVEDGRGRPLGRSFGVKLWPTLVFLKDGREISRLVRPQNSAEIAAAMKQICPELEVRP